ncbi:hypothetical protein DWB78_09225 [Halopelagius longus]|uniref:Uncharacterized protein n=1 Tax=Halopelagius longus TaxID=1236180 RepID=A0A370IMF9_9EURY|nr:hypothetical protein DWB78_09225 [Halopelagius longus]
MWYVSTRFDSKENRPTAGELYPKRRGSEPASNRGFAVAPRPSAPPPTERRSARRPAFVRDDRDSVRRRRGLSPR